MDELEAKKGCNFDYVHQVPEPIIVRILENLANDLQNNWP